MNVNMDYNLTNGAAKNKKLKIDKRAPQIIIPADKIKMFQDWWNTDIRFEKSIPHSFNAGYLIIDGLTSGININKLPEAYNTLIKTTAHLFNTTYRNIYNQFVGFVSSVKTLTVVFNFIKEDTINVAIYDNVQSPVAAGSFTIGDSTDMNIKSNVENEIINKFNEEYYFDDASSKSLEDFSIHLFQGAAVLLITSLWYIATTSRSTKYIYEQKTPSVTSRHKSVVNVSDTKYISTPVYDMNKIRVIKVDKLKARKKGWTYSHSFQVHGHYRHYANGKTIFIEPYIKGKNKEFKGQQIILKPDKL